MKKRNIILCSAFAILLLLASLCLFSCGGKKQDEKISKLSPDIYPAANVEYEYNSDGAPAVATVFKGKKAFCKYEYVYDKDGVLEKRIEKNAKDILLCEYEYENGKTLKYKTVYSDDGVIETKFKYDEDGLIVKRTNYNDDGNEELKIDYYENGKVFLTTEYKYYDDGTLSGITKTGEQGVAESLYYNSDGNLRDEYNYTYYPYSGYKICKHTEYDEEGSFETAYESKYDYNNEHMISEKALREDGTGIFYRINNDYDNQVMRYIEYDENGLEALLKCFNEYGLNHYVLYDSGKTISWTEYRYDENGKLTERIEHPVEGKYIKPDGTDAEIYMYDVAENETEYEYVDLDEWEFPDNISAKKYFYSTDLIFEEGDTVSVDELMIYFTLCEMRDKNNSYKLYEHLEQYRTGTDAHLYEISIPKEIVDSEIEKHFAVKVDGSDSQYTDPENEDCYLLYPDARGMMSVVMKNYTVDGDRSTAIYAFYGDISGEIYQKAEICIENEDSEEEFKIIYVREVE